MEGFEENAYIESVTTTNVDFVPCLKWIKRGVAKQLPDKIELTPEELEAVVRDTRNALNELNEEDAENDDSDNEPTNPEDEYNMEDYDNENESSAVFGISTVCDTTEQDPYITVEEDADSEKEDDEIHPEDNLLLIGRVQGDASILEVYVYNEREDSFYVHHDLLLPAFPLCLEWLSHDPSEENPGNLCAVGTTSPIIEVWDLDIVNCLEPAFKLGKLPKKKKRIKRVGHKDAVLDLSWNPNLPHLLASGSVDQTVLLWDLDSGEVGSKLTSFKEKVQSLKWHPFEDNVLLTGCSDSNVRVFDCKANNSSKSWELSGEVERVIWNHLKPFYFLAGTSTGHVYCCDCRTETPLWTLSAHEKEITGLSLSSQCPGMLVTTGTEGTLKIWDIAEDNPVFVFERSMELGSLLALDACPDLPFLFCASGDKKSGNITLFDAMEFSGVKNKFSNRNLLRPVAEAAVSNGSEADTMDTTDGATTALDSLSLQASSSATTNSQRHKKKNFKHFSCPSSND